MRVTPIALVLTVCSSFSMSNSMFCHPIPLLCRYRSIPSISLMRSRSRAGASSLVTSIVRDAMILSCDATRLSRSSVLLPATPTFHPFSANCMAISFPIPEVAPRIIEFIFFFFLANFSFLSFLSFLSFFSILSLLRFSPHNLITASSNPKKT